MYPNPSNSGLFTVRMDEVGTDHHLEIIDITGKRIKSLVVNNTTERIDLSNSPKGMYLLRFAGQVKTIVID